MKQNWECCCIGVDASIRDAAEAINRAGLGIALLTDEDRRLLGTITDGDLRRALLAASSLDEKVEPHARRDSTVVGAEVVRGEVLDLMQALLIRHIPIVDSVGRVVGLHLLHETIRTSSLDNWAVIMAGGRGNRLGNLTSHMPKPMLRVAGRPILERLIWHLVGFGIRKIFLSVNYLGALIEQHFGDGRGYGCRIEYLRESEPLGTGGSLALLPETPTNPILVCNGDLVTQADLGSLFRYHAQGGFAATIGVRTHTWEVPFGCVEVQEGEVVSLEEKPVQSRLISAGIYVVEPALLDTIPLTFYPITNLFEDCLQRGDRIGSFEIEEDWIDVGQKEHLQQARGV